MTHNRLPKEFREEGLSNPLYYQDVVMFLDRLVDLQESFVVLANSVKQSYPELPAGEQKQMAYEYAELASFTGYLAGAARKLNAEVSETDAAFHRHMAALHPQLKQYLGKNMDKALIEEVGGNHDDGDPTSFTKQISAFTAKLRERYNLSPRQR